MRAISQIRTVSGAEEALTLLRERGRRMSYDALLVDEIQDLCDAELQLLSALSERIMFVGDIRQQVYLSSDLMSAAENLCDRTVELKHHFRISHEICLVADRILQNDDFSLAEYEHYSGPAPTRPAIVGPLSPSDQVGALIEALDLQLDTYNDPSDLIGVVVGRMDECDDVLERLNSVPKLNGRCAVFHSGVSKSQVR